MTAMLTFSVPGEPRGKGRPKATARGGFRDDVLVDRISAGKRWALTPGVDVVLCPLFEGAAA